MARPRKVNPDTVALAKREYARMIDNGERDKNGFYIMTPTPEAIDEKSDELTSSIESLEDKLRRYKEEKKHYEDLKQTPEYKNKTSKKQKKKDRKERQNLLEAVFNNADRILDRGEEESSDEDEYEDTPKAKRRAAAKARQEKKKETTLTTTYGTRYAPLVSMLYDMAQEFDDAAETIQTELNSKQGSTRGMYRSAQMGNYLTAKKQKFDVVKELVSVANKVTDIEYKKEKDNKAEEGDTTRAITYLGAQFLRGTDRDTGKNKMTSKTSLTIESKGKKKKDKSKKEKTKSSKHDDDDDDDGEVSSYVIDDSGAVSTDKNSADKFIKTLLGRRDDIKLDPHEYYINMEGKYKFVVVADAEDPDSDWDFVAVDPNTDKKLKNFKEQYRELYPKKKACRMRFDLERGCAIDKNTNMKYPLKLK